jgi:hypothetical protein
MLGACASAHRPITDRPPIPPSVPTQFLHFEDATVAKGDVAPDFTLQVAGGPERVTLSSLRGRPLVLVFGSHT